MKAKTTKLIVLLCIALFQFTDSFSQLTTVLPNDGSTSGNCRAPSNRYSRGRIVYLIKASEMAAAGFTSGTQVGQIGWTYQAAPGNVASAPLLVYLQNTTDVTNTKSTTWSTAIAPMTIASNSTVSIANSTTPTIAFSGGSPFTYTGGGVYVAYDWGCYSGTLFATTVMCNSTGLVNGLLSAQLSTACPNTASTNVVASSFRPETRFGPVQVANDAAVDLIYTFGSLANVFTVNHAIRAKVSNLGTATQTNLPVSLNISGANTFTNTQTVATLAPGASAVVTFAAFTPSVIGSNTVTVSVPSDGANGNNTKTMTQAITTNLDSYKYGTTFDGGVGFNPPLATSAVFVSKFNAIAGSLLNEVKVDFQASVASRTFKIAVYPNNAGTPGNTPLYVSSLQTIGANSPQFQAFIPISPVINLSGGDFYVGVVEEVANTVNFGFSYQAESPARTGSFFFANVNNTTYVASTAWTDFNTGGAPFRPGIEAEFFVPAPPNCVLSMSPANNNVDLCFGGASQTLSWASGGGGPTGYDVYFGTTANPPLVSANQAGVTYNATGLTPNTQYFWKVIAKNVDGDAPGCSTFSFTTGSTFSPVSISPANITICGGAPVTATANPAGATSYSWSGGLGSAQTASVTTPGTYTVTVTQSTCVLTATATAVAYSSPTVSSVSATPSAVCNGGSSVLAVSASASNAVTGNYCTPVTTNGGTVGDEITLFSSTGLGYNYTNSVATPSPGYLDRTNLIGNGVAGTAYSVTVNQQDAGDAFRIWIDMNNNGSFEDAGELLATSTAGLAVTLSITIPSSTTNGSHRIRIRNTFNATNTIASTLSCTNGNTYGVTIDFTLNVTGGVDPLTYLWSPATFLGSTTGSSVGATGITSPVTYTVTATQGNTGCTNTGTASVAVNPLPIGSASNETICSGASSGVALSSDITGSTFTWTATVTSGNVTGLSGCASGCGTTIAQTLINTSNSVAGVVSYIVTPTSPSGCAGNPFTVDVTVNPKPAGTITNATICSGGTTNIVLNSSISGTTFAWSGANQSGTSTGFSSGNGSPIVQTLFNSSNSTPSIVRYTIVPTSPAGCTGANFLSDITVNPTPVASSSVDPGEFLCDGSTTNIDLNSSTSGSSTYTWTSTADAGISGNSNCSSGCLNPIADVLFNTASTNGTATYSIIPTSAAGCVGGAYTITETIGATPVGSATSMVICNGDPTNLTLNSTVTGTEFTWTSLVTFGTVIGNQDCPGGCGTTIADVLTNATNVHGIVEYTVSPVSADGCPGADFTVDVTVGAAPAMPVISGPSVVCNLNTATYSVAIVPEATTYTWTVPTGVTGMTITSGQGTTTITVNISAGTVIGNVTCTASNNCGSSQTASMAVTKKPAVPGPISGPTSTCGQTSATYFIASVFGATSYAWTVPAGMTITSGQGGLTITVSISSTFVSGLVKVSAVNACGNVPGISLLVFGNVPPIPVSISGPTAVCGLTSATYSVPAVAGATGYNWTITGAGTIVGSNTGSSVTVALSGTSPGTISCSATNVCGTGTPRSLNLTTTPATPGTISGPTVACGLFTATYTVPAVAGTTYNWTLQTAVGCFGTSFPGGPQTATGTTVTVAFSPNFMNAMSGVLSVTATTQCGTSNPSNLIIFQNQTPTTLNGPANVTGLQQATYFTSPMNGAIDYVWTTTSTGGQITINGTTATTVITPSLSITAFFTGQSGVYSGTGQIKVAARYSCVDRATQTSGYKTVPISGVALNPNAMANNTDLRSVFSEIYPNPASTEFTIDVTSDGDRNIVVEVFDVLGNMAIEQKHYLMAGEVAFKTNVETLEKGMYFVRITDVEGNVLYTQRVIKE